MEYWVRISTEPRVFHPNLDARRGATNCIINGPVKRELHRFSRGKAFVGADWSSFFKRTRLEGAADTFAMRAPGSWTWKVSFSHINHLQRGRTILLMNLTFSRAASEFGLLLCFGWMKAAGDTSFLREENFVRDSVATGAVCVKNGWWMARRSGNWSDSARAVTPSRLENNKLKRNSHNQRCFTEDDGNEDEFSVFTSLPAYFSAHQCFASEWSRLSLRRPFLSVNLSLRQRVLYEL